MTDLESILKQSLGVLAKLPDSTGLTRCAYFFQLATLLNQAANKVNELKKVEGKNQNGTD